MRKSSRFSAVITIALILLAVGCQSNPVHQAETLMAQDNYRGVLSLLDSVKGNDPNLRLIKMKAFFVEGQSGQGWGMALKDTAEREAVADQMYAAAVVIAREKNRTDEVTILLDSAIAWNPGLEHDALALAWQRGLEYLGVAGDAGFKLMAFSARHDSSTVTRLMGANPALAQRYEEIRLTYIILTRLDAEVKQWMKTRSEPLETLEQLPLEDEQIAHPGWNLRLDPLPGRGYRITAEPVTKNVKGILPGTRLVVQ